MQLKDVSLLLKIVLELISVTLDLATQSLENASSPLLYVTTTMHVPLTVATRLLENANLLQRTVMTTTHVLQTAATEIPDVVLMFLKFVTIITFVLETLVTQRLENASLKTSLQKLLQKKPTNVSLPNATHKRDSFKLLLFAKLKTNVLNHTVTQAEDVFTNQLSVMLSQEEHHTDVTQTVESVNVNNLAVTTTMHVPLMHM
jgi:hypothetical protein